MFQAQKADKLLPLEIWINKFTNNKNLGGRKGGDKII